jgi:hypothetical protein
MKKILLLSVLLISQFTFAQDDSQSDLEKLLGKAQDVLSQVELPDLKKEINSEFAILAWNPYTLVFKKKLLNVVIDYSDENEESLNYETDKDEFKESEIFKSIADKGYKLVNVDRFWVTGLVYTKAYFVKYK